MRFKNTIAMLAVAAAVAFLTSVRAAPTDATSLPTSGPVRMLVRGPGGRPVPHAKIIIENADAHRFVTEDSPRLTTTTDGDGVARFDWPQGGHQASITAPGIGYGVTGLFETAPDLPAEADLPPLVAMSRVEGSVKSGETVTCTFDNDPPFDVAVDPTGHFSIEGRSGWWKLLVVDDGKPVRKSVFQVDWGETVRDVKFESAVQKPTGEPPATAVPPDEPESDQPVTWVTGVVRYPDGKPVVGATVCLSGTFAGAVRPDDITELTNTDSNGRYLITGSPRLWNLYATVLVHKPGMPYALAWFSFDESKSSEGEKAKPVQAPVAVRDFVLAEHGGTVDVALKSEGKPAAGLSVVLLPTDEAVRSCWIVRMPDENRHLFTDRVFPTATSDQNGKVRIDDLPPGRYEVVATSGDVHDWQYVAAGVEPKQKAAVWGSADGVCVVTGESTAVDVNVYPHQWTADMRFDGPGGKPIPTSHPAFSAVRRGEQAISKDAIELDRDGNLDSFLGSVGLWNVSIQYPPGKSNGRRPGEPFFAAEGVVGISALLHVKQPPTFSAVWQEPGTVDVDLLDADGKPAAGIVTLGRWAGELMLGTAVDGHIQFKGVPSSDKVVAGYLAGQKLPYLVWEDSEPLPKDEELRGHQFVPTESFSVGPLSHRRIVLRAVPAGYVRGHLHLEKIEPGIGWAIDPREQDSRGAGSQIDPGNGDFVAGPFVPGEIHLRVSGVREAAPSSSPSLLLDQTIMIKPGEVTLADLVPAPMPPVRHPTLMGFNGTEITAEGAQLIAGKVFLSDGKSPAYDARLYFFDRNEDWSTEAAATDAAGRIQGLSYWAGAFWLPPPPPGGPTGPVVVALLPGVAGATIVDCAAAPAAPMLIVLPPPVSVHGKLTVGGKSPAGLNGKLQIYAAYQGRGKLNDVLSITATPNQDGTFVLPGLTPGTYLVQASLDGIWLSESQTLTVAAQDLPPIALDIPDPAGPVAVSVVDKHGRPVIGQTVTVDRPAGPLTDRYWPRDFKTDGAGVAQLPPLEAGIHHVHVGTAVVDVTPPPPVCDGPARFAIKIGD